MRTDENGLPLAHLLPDPLAGVKEAAEGLALLLRQGQIIEGREKRAKAAERLKEQGDAITAAKLAQAQLIADRMEWKPHEAVILFERQTCERCGCVNHVFQGFGVKMRQKASAVERIVIHEPGPGSNREAFDRGLPPKLHILVDTVAVCYDCVDEFIAEGSEITPYVFVPGKRPEQ